MRSVWVTSLLGFDKLFPAPSPFVSAQLWPTDHLLVFWESQVPAAQLFPLDPITQCVDEESNPTALCDPSRVFGLDIQGRDCGNEAAQWFTNFLKTEAFRMVQFEKNMKGRPSSKIFPSVGQNYQVSLQRAALHFWFPSGPTKSLSWGLS